MQHDISQLIDLPALQALMETLHRATGISHALIDNQSRVLSAAGWEPVCTDFHRADPRSCERCLQSDRHILDHLGDGPYVGYDCPNGLVDYATPVVIDGVHVANMFTGQMFHAPPDLEFFRRQAAEFGFEEGPYLAAVQRVRIVPRERMPDVMGFLAGLARLLADQGLARLRQLEAERKLRQLNDDLYGCIAEQTQELQRRNQRLSREIAAHERMEAALLEEKQFSDDIINGLPGIFYMLDEQARFIRWNARLCEVTGYSAEELAQLPALAMFEAEAAAVIRERIGEVFRNGEATAEAELLTRDGRRLPYHFSGRTTRIGNRVYLVGLGIDISERTMAEQLLRESEGRFRNLFEHSPVAYLALDADGGITEVNEKLCELLGQGRETLLGTRFPALTQAESRTGLAAQWATLAAEGHMAADLRLTRGDGRPLAVRLEGRAQRDRGGVLA